MRCSCSCSCGSGSRRCSPAWPPPTGDPPRRPQCRTWPPSPTRSSSGRRCWGSLSASSCWRSSEGGAAAASSAPAGSPGPGMGGEARPAPGAAGGLALTIVEGGAVLAVEGRPLPPLGRADRLEIEVPGLRFPFDVSGGVSRFASRRCRLRELAVSAGAAEVASFLRGERLAEMGIFDPLVAIAGAELTVEGWARLGRHQAGFTVRAAVRSLAPRRARISLYDVRVYGLLPVSAPMLASALFAATGATPGEPRPPHPGAVPAGAPLLWLEGATDLQLELVELALLALLPAQGWRMPERGQAGPLAVESAPGRVVLRYG